MEKRGRKKGTVNHDYLTIEDLMEYGAKFIPVKSSFANEVRSTLNWKNGVSKTTIQEDDDDDSNGTPSDLDIEFDDFSDDE